jgi:endo-1,4-beta-mannosidase
MWTRYDGSVVRDELAVLAEHGLNVTRSFCYWPDFMPEPEQLDEEVAARFGDFLDAHAECGLGTIPTVIVGHMSGENWDPAWRQGRDLYRDVWLVSQQAWLASEMARRFVSGTDNGYSLRSLAPLVDFVGPHVYPMQDDEVRQFLTPAFVCELAGSFGKPVVLEEFGVSSDFASDEHVANYYRLVLHSTLIAGARGWIAWSSSDYDEVRTEDPYRHHVFETHFGLTDREGRPKKSLRALADFSRLAAGLSAEGWQPIKGEVALVVPEHFERVLPFTSPEYREDIRDNLLQSYVTAREADLPVELVRERDGVPGTPRLVLAPCAKLLTAPGIDRLRELARAGATVYLSYFAGSTAHQRGPWLAWLDEIFGVRHRLRYGLVDPIVEQEAVLELLTIFGDLPAGTKLTFRVAGSPSSRAYLPVEAAGAEVVAVDAAGRPALLRHRLGSGCTILCTYPLEHMAARRAWANPESTWRIYSALALEAGVSRPVRVADPRVLVGRVRAGDSETALFLNCSGQQVSVEPIVDNAVNLGDDRSRFSLEPFGVTACRYDIAADDAIVAEAELARPLPGGSGEGGDANG